MGETAATLFLTGLSGYLAVGFVFAVAFVLMGAQRIDPTAAGMPIRARLTILPGSMLLWPLMAVKWMIQKEPPVQ